VTVFNPMSRGSTVAADIRGSFCLLCSINIHQDGITRGGVGMGKVGRDWAVETEVGGQAMEAEPLVV
jgi:hypothetical protein